MAESLLNHCIKTYPLAPFLLRAILWGQEDDPEKKYPITGRVRYVWLEDNYETICLLLKNGPKSKSPDKKEVWKQLERHETLIEWRTVERDPSYIIARFKPIAFSYAMQGKGSDFFNELMFNLQKYDQRSMQIAKEKIGIDFQSLLDNPFDLFDKHLAKYDLSDLSMDYNKMALSLKEKVLEAMADVDMAKVLKEKGISGYKTDPIRVFGVDRNGNMTDISSKEFDDL